MNMAYTYEYPHFAVTVDNVVINNNDRLNPKILLIKRKNDPYKGCWALPGGFLDQEDEDAKAAAIRELKEETNLDLNPQKFGEICTMTKRGRDPRERVIDIAFGTVLSSYSTDVYYMIKAQDDAAEVEWVSLKELVYGDLAFDHAEILVKAIRKMLISNHDYRNPTPNEFLIYGNCMTEIMGHPGELDKVTEEVLFDDFIQ